MLIRGQEWLARQKVSLLDVRWLGEGSLKLLYKSSIKTAEQIMQTPTEVIVQELAEHGGFIRQDSTSRERVEVWKRSIRGLWLKNVGPPLPQGWEGETDQADE